MTAASSASETPAPPGAEPWHGLPGREGTRARCPCHETERARWFDAWLIILVAPVVIAGCVSAPFLGFDDTEHVGHPALASGVPWYGIFRVTPRSTYFPVTLLSYRLDRWFYGGWLHLLFPESGNAPGYRLTSLLIHLASALVLWRIFLRLKAGRWCSLFAAAAWVAHPAACESVAWISERKNVLAACFGFVALWFWCREWEAKRGWLRGPVTACFYLLAIMSKPTAAGFLAVLAAYEFLYKPGAHAGRRARWLTWAAWLAMLLATGVSAWANVKGHEGVFSSRMGGSIINTALTDVEILRLYICNMLLPLWLSFLYEVEAITSFGDVRLWASAVFLAACVFISLWLAANRKLGVFLWCWFLGALLPALNIIPIWEQMQDRHAYSSLPALLLLLALTVAGAARRSKVPPVPRLSFLATLGAVAGLAALAANRSELFDYDVTLFRDAVAKQPSSIYIREHLGVALARDAETFTWTATPEQQPQLLAQQQEALQLLSSALKHSEFRLRYHEGEVRIAMGILNMRLGHAAEARKLILSSSKGPLRPRDLVSVHMALAQLALDEDHPQEALKYLQQAAGECEGGIYTDVLYWMGRSLEKLGKTADALLAYRAIPSGDLVGTAAAARIKQLTTGE